jgi:hypothetical protein
MLGPEVPSFFPDDAPNIVKDGTPAGGAVGGLLFASTV